MAKTATEPLPNLSTSAITILKATPHTIRDAVVVSGRHAAEIDELKRHGFIESSVPRCIFDTVSRTLEMSPTYKRTKAGTKFLNRLAKEST